MLENKDEIVEMTPEKTSEYIDGAGLKFLVMREIGEDADISFVVRQVRGNSKDLKVSHYFRGHEYSDGMGVWRELYKKLYCADSDHFPDVPVARSSNKPGHFKRVYFFMAHLWRQRPRNYKFIKWNHNATGRPEGFCCYRFTKEDTLKLKINCQNSKVSLSALMLNHADNVFSTLLIKGRKENAKRVWMMPVNTREELEKNLEWGNFVTTISVYMNDSQKLSDLNKQIKGLLKSGIMWGGKWVANFPKFLGIKRLRKMATRDVKAPYLGLVSNLGAWGDANSKFGKNDQIIVVPTVSKLAPVSIAAFEWNGELTLGWHLHPALDIDLKQLNILASSMVTKMLDNEDDINVVDTLLWSDISLNIDLNPKIIEFVIDTRPLLF